MSKKNETPRSSVPNKKKESAIYRKIETLTISLISRTRNLPNVPMIKEVCRKLTSELIDCGAAVCYAYSTLSYDVRYGYLEEMGVHLTLIKTCVRVLFEYASSSKSNFMTPTQIAEYLMMLDDIEMQRDRWMVSTYKYLQGQNSISTENNESPENELTQTKGSVVPKDEDFGIPENTQFMALDSERVITGNSLFRNEDC